MGCDDYDCYDSSQHDVIFDELPVIEQTLELSLSATADDTSVASAPLVPVRVKRRSDADSNTDEPPETHIVQMALLSDLRNRLDKRELSMHELSELVPEMAEFHDDNGACAACRPQCMVCLDELREGQAVSRPHCGHTFHHECLATWLLSQLQSKQVGACPHCKYTIVVPILQRVEAPTAHDTPASGNTHTPSRTTSSRLGFNFKSIFGFKNTTRVSRT